MSPSTTGAGRVAPLVGDPSLEARVLAVRRFELRARGEVESLLAGEYRSTFRGTGLEPESVREYRAGDDARAIDWRVTARLGRAHVREFVEERDLAVMLVVDRSASMSHGPGFRSETIALELAATLALVAARSGDRVGLVQFTDRTEGVVPPDRGLRHALRIVRDLLAMEPRGRGTELGQALDRSRRHLPNRSLVFVLSDFLVPDAGRESLTEALRRLRGGHDVVPIWLDPDAAGRLPRSGLVTLSDPESGRVAAVDTRAGDRKRGRDRWEAGPVAMEAVFHRTGLRALSLPPDKDPLAALRDYLAARRSERPR